MRTPVQVVVVLAFGCCAHENDLDLTAAEHRNEAAILTADARAQRAEYVPDDHLPLPAARPDGDDATQWADGDRSYNPTARQLEVADTELRAAAEHLLAARRLESFEDARCAGVAPSERAACPLLASAVTKVQETKSGILLTLAPTVDAADTERRLRCHLAYAVARGFERPSCPLFVKGMNLALLPGAHPGIAMTSDDPLVAAQLKIQARRIFLHPADRASPRSTK